MLNNIAKKLFGTPNERYIKKISLLVEQINTLEDKIKNLSDTELKNNTSKFKENYKNNKDLDSLLPEAFATVREASKRVLGQRHYDAQIIGGITLHQGKIAEMKTGEGKTLVATLTAYLNALNNQPVHIITVNDYLAQRDSKWMGEIYKFLGLSVGCITSTTPQELRSKEYKCNVLYVTNHEITFDYLRDNLKNNYENIFFKERGFAIVDEVDSILVDEARTPIAISSESQSSVKL